MARKKNIKAQVKTLKSTKNCGKKKTKQNVQKCPKRWAWNSVCSFVLDLFSLSGSGLDKMSATKYTKLQMVNHIRHLFRLRTETFRPSFWDCVLRNGRLMVIRSFARELDDRVIMHCLLDTGRLPSLLSTYLAIRKNWQLLSNANTEVSGGFDVDSCCPATINGRTHYRRRGLLAKYGKFLTWAKSFVRKRLA